MADENNTFNIFDIIPESNFKANYKKLVNDYNINISDMLDIGLSYAEIYDKIKSAARYDCSDLEKVFTAMLFSLDPRPEAPEIQKLINQRS